MQNPSNILFKPEVSLTMNLSESAKRITLPAAKSGSKLMVSLISSFAILTLILNGLILAIFIMRPNLRTPFNTYVINLVSLDVLSVLIPMNVNIVREIFGQWPLNGLACTIVLCASRMVNSGNRVAHLLITANRFWAVTFPLSYRTRHTKRLAVGVVLSAWSLTVCFVTPEVMVGRIHVNYSLSAGDPICTVETNSYTAYHTTFAVVVYDMPEVVILVACIWIMFKLRRRGSNLVSGLPVKAGQPEALDSSKPTDSSRNAQVTGPTLENLGNLQHARGSGDQLVTENLENKNPKVIISLSQPSVLDQAHLEVHNDMHLKRQKPPSRSKGHNRLFAYLVMSVTCCWTPNHVYFLWSAITGLYSAQFFTVQYFMVYVNSWLNPILIYLADLRIQTVVNDWIRCRQS